MENIDHYWTNEIFFCVCDIVRFCSFQWVASYPTKHKTSINLYFHFSVLGAYLMMADLDNRNMLQCMKKLLYYTYIHIYLYKTLLY